MCLVSESLNLWFITWLLGLNTHQIPKSQGNWHLLLDHGWNLPHKASSWTKKHLTQILHPEKQLPLRLRSSKFCNCLTLINTFICMQVYSEGLSDPSWPIEDFGHSELRESNDLHLSCTFLFQDYSTLFFYFIFFKCLTLQHLLELVITLKLENRTHKQRYRFLNGTHLVGEVVTCKNKLKISWIPDLKIY